MRFPFARAVARILSFLLLVFAGVASAQNTLFIRSQNGAGLIGEPFRTVTDASGAFVLTGSAAGDQISVKAGDYLLQLRVPSGQTIGPGSFDASEKYSADVTSRTAINFSPYYDTNFCNTASGHFQVLELVRNAQGTVTTFAVNFERLCNNYSASTFGQLRYNSALPVDVDRRTPDGINFAPVIGAVPGTVVVSQSATISGLDAAIPVSISTGEYSLNGGAYTSGTGTVIVGDTVRVRATAPPVANSATIATLDLNGYRVPFAVGTITGATPQAGGSPLIVLVGQPQYGNSNSQITVFAPATGQIIRTSRSISPYNNSGIRIESSELHNGGPNYYLELDRPTGSTVMAGTYLNVSNNPAPGQGALFYFAGYSNVLGGPVNCEYGTVSTDVTVQEIEYAPDGMPTKLAMDFVASCPKPFYPGSNGFSRIHGHIRINSTLPIDYAVRLPIAFDFPGVSGATTNTQYISATGSASGISVPMPVSITGGEYSIGNGAFTAAPGTISNNETIRVRLTSAATGNTLRVAMLTMGGVEFPFKVGTATGNTPQPTTEPLLVLVSVPRSATQPVLTQIYSPATLAPFSLSKQSYSSAFTVTVNPFQNYGYSWQGEFSGAINGQLVPGNYPQAGYYMTSFQPSLRYLPIDNCYPGTDPSIRMTVPELDYANDGTPTRLAANFVINCRPDSTFATQYGYLRVNSTAPIDYTIDMPAPFPFTPVIGQAQGTSVISNEVIMRAMNVPLAISIVGGEYSIDGGPFTSAPGVIFVAQKLRVRAIAAGQSDTVTVMAVSVGARTETFTVATLPDAAPQPHGPALAVIYRQDFSTGLTTQQVFSPSTLANVSLGPSTYADARTIVQIGTNPPVQNANPPWTLILAGPGQTLLQVGTYVSNGDNSSGTRARFTSSSGGYTIPPVASCYVNTAGDLPRPTRFFVREIELSVTGETLRLALDYIINCVEVGTPPTGNAAVFGFIRINSTVPIDHTIAQPTPFYFATALAVSPSTLVQSEEITINGMNVVVPIGIAGGEYSIDGGAYTAANGTISAGQRVRVRATASALANQLTSATLTIGGISGDFRIGTSAGYPPMANGNPLIYLISQGSEVIGAGKTYLFSPANSYNVTATRYNYSGAYVTARLSTADCCGGWSMSFVGPNSSPLAPGVYNNAQNYANSSLLPTMRISSPNYYGCNSLTPTSQFTVYEVEYASPDYGAAVTKLAIDFVNTCSGNPDPLYGYIRFNSTVPINPIADSIPSPFSFASAFGATAGAMASSMPAVIGGFNVALPISIANGEYSLDGGAFTSAPGIINSGQSVRVRTTAAFLFGGHVFATLTIGSRSAIFDVYTEYADSYPDPITFPTVSGAARNSVVTSSAVAVTGINVASPISNVSGGEISVAGRPFSNAMQTIMPGETLQMRLTTSSQYNAGQSVVAYIGGMYTSFTAQTISQGVLQITINGNGRVNVTPVGNVCTNSCSNLYDNGSQLTLTATAGGGVVFTGWSGAGCSDTGPCVITLNLTASVSANFSALPPGAPAITGATPGNSQATLFLAAPMFTGGVPVTSYTASCQPGSVSTLATSLPITVTGLTNETAYLCSVTATNSAGTGAASNSISVTPSAAAPLGLISVTSRKTHGLVGDFDVTIDSQRAIDGAVSVEPRIIGNGHKIVFRFNNAITTAGTVAVIDANAMPIGAASVAMAGSEAVVTLTDVPDKTRVTVALTGVNGTLDVSASLGFLVGDVDNSRVVNSFDLSAVKSRSGTVTDGGNFQFDINTSGAINSADIVVLKRRAGRSLP